MQQLKFLCGRFRVTRQVLSSQAGNGPSWPLASLLTKKQADDLSSLAASMKRLLTSWRHRQGPLLIPVLDTILMRLQTEVSPARPS